MPDIHIEREHSLGLPRARELAFKWAEAAEARLQMECTYEEGKASDLVSFTRSGVNGELRVTKDRFELHARLREGWNLPPERLRTTDEWVANAGNASFGAQAAYDELVPGFEALFESVGRDWVRFYDEAKRLAALPKTERHAYLKRKESPRA